MVPAFYTLISVATLWFVLLWVCSRLPTPACSRRVNLGFGIATVLILFLPVDGLRLWSWAFSFCPNPSLPLLGMVCAGLWQRLFGIAVFKPADWRATWIFGVVVGSALYLHTMLIGSLDLYYWGWDRESAVWSLAALSVAFLACGNRHGVLLLAALIAHAVDALESANCWDYIIDPFYWMISVGVLVTRSVAGCRVRWRGGRPVDPLPPLVVVAELPKPVG
jgi:hypothetical protein